MGTVLRVSRRFMQRMGRECFAAVLRNDQTRLQTYFDNLPETQWLQLAACIKVAATEKGRRMKNLVMYNRNLLEELDAYERNLEDEE